MSSPVFLASAKIVAAGIAFFIESRLTFAQGGLENYDYCHKVDHHEDGVPVTGSIRLFHFAPIDNAATGLHEHFPHI